MAKTKLKVKTAEQALSVCEQQLAEYAAEISTLQTEAKTNRRRFSEELETCCADRRVVRARNEALQAALVMAHNALRRCEEELREEGEGDKLALAG